MHSSRDARPVLAGATDGAWRDLFVQSPSIVLVLDADGGRILEATEAAHAFYGYPRRTLVGLRYAQIDPRPRDVVLGGLAGVALTAADGRWPRVLHRLASGAVRTVDVVFRAVQMGERTVIVAVVDDVTAETRAQAERDRLVTAVEQAAESVVITDADARIEYVNPAFERVTGFTRAEVIGRNPRILKSGIQSQTFYDAMWAAISNGLPWVADMTNRRKDGTFYQEEAVITPIRDGSGVITGYVAVKRDVTRERALEVEGMAVARERAFILKTLQSLPTGLAPDVAGAAVCRQIVSMTGLTHAHLFLFGDDGRAQPIGLATADGRTDDPSPLPLARSLELRERAALGPWIEDWLARPGHPYNQLVDGLGVRAAAYVPVRVAGALVGILIVGAQAASATATLSAALPGLIDFADVASAILAPALAATGDSARARQRIAQVIEQVAFQTVFQPIVFMATSEVVGYEALTRFQDQTPPDVVFAEARRVGLEQELELATMRVARDAAGGLPPSAFLSLNASPGLILAGGAVSELIGGIPRDVVVEVTEHESIADYAALRAALVGLRPDVRLAVDDAGAGVANFQHLVGLRPQYIKVDAGLVRGVDGDPSRQALIVALLHFAGATGAEVIAEGIETDAELAVLRRLGVGLGQGYLLARPAPAATFRG